MREYVAKNVYLYNENYIDVLEGIEDKSIDCIITDPPYLHVKGGMTNKRFSGVWDKSSQMVMELGDFGREKIFEFLDKTLPKMKKANYYIFCSRLQLLYYFEWLAQRGHKKYKYDLLVWDNGKSGMKSTKFFNSDIEYIVKIYESGVQLNKVIGESGKADVRYYNKLKSYKKPNGKHNTMKPTGLIEEIMLVSTKEGEIVFDPFAGTGTTGEVCLETGRKFIGCEINKEFFDIAINRLEGETDWSD